MIKSLNKENKEFDKKLKKNGIKSIDKGKAKPSFLLIEDNILYYRPENVMEVTVQLNKTDIKEIFYYYSDEVVEKPKSNGIAILWEKLADKFTSRRWNGLREHHRVEIRNLVDNKFDLPWCIVGGSYVIEELKMLKRDGRSHVDHYKQQKYAPLALHLVYNLSIEAIKMGNEVDFKNFPYNYDCDCGTNWGYWKEQVQNCPKCNNQVDPQISDAHKKFLLRVVGRSTKEIISNISLKGEPWKKKHIKPEFLLHKLSTTVIWNLNRKVYRETVVIRYQDHIYLLLMDEYYPPVLIPKEDVKNLEYVFEHDITKFGRAGSWNKGNEQGVKLTLDYGIIYAVSKKKIKKNYQIVELLLTNKIEGKYTRNVWVPLLLAQITWFIPILPALIQGPWNNGVSKRGIKRYDKNIRTLSYHLSRNNININITYK